MTLKHTLLTLASSPYLERALAPFAPRAVILMYHRVLPNDTPPPDALDRGLGVTQERFEQHLSLIAARHRFLALDDLPRHLQSKEPMGVVITFDDGYRDTLELALPVLEKYRAPATVFVSTRYPDGDCRVWWLELVELLRELPRLQFRWQDRDLAFELRNEAERREAFTVLRDLMLGGLSPEQQEKLMDMLRQGRPPRRYDELFMTWEMLRELAGHPGIAIGAHTMGHVNLAALDPDRARDEIMGARERLEQMLQCQIRHMAYPYGSAREAGPREYALARDFATAVTTRSGVVRANAPLHALARLGASQKDDAARLAFKLGGLFPILAGLRRRMAK